MAISNATRTHLIYQFIILTLLFLGIGYNELLPDRKFILFLAFLPIFCYQLAILSCCVELIPVPRWMGFLESVSKKSRAEVENFGCDSQSSSSTLMTTDSSRTQTKKILNFPDVSEISCPRRWEKSATNLGISPKCFAYPQKSKSWMSLNESKSSTERLLSREGSLDILGPSSDKLAARILNKSDKTRSRGERATKAKSWKPCETNFDDSERTELAESTALSHEKLEPTVSNYTAVHREESELSKSYSFPFRQKKLGTWLESKETSTGESNQSLNMPYWQTVGYNLAVKYEARRRRKAKSNPTKSDLPNEDSVQIVHKSADITTDSAQTDRSNSKKSAKSASACINKLRVGISNLISKKKDEGTENSNVNPNKANKAALLLKLKCKNISCLTKEKGKLSNIPSLPQFLSDDRPLLFYPKYIPFEKERFDSDVKKKMKELSEEQG